MCSIFDEISQTDRRKKYVREHESDFDAKKICKKLVDFYVESAKASANVADMLSCIASARLESWKGTAESFILN